VANADAGLPSGRLAKLWYWRQFGGLAVAAGGSEQTIGDEELRAIVDDRVSNSRSLLDHCQIRAGVYQVPYPNRRAAAANGRTCDAVSAVTRDRPIGRVVKCRRPDLPVYACETI
jgi:hypothetical protein